MILVVDKVKMIENVERAKRMSSSPISLMFKDFYVDFYSDKFNSCTTFSNSESSKFDVTSNINNRLTTSGKVITTIRELNYNLRFNLRFTRLYVPINFLDNREGVGRDRAKDILKAYNNKAHSFLMVTSGCINNHGPSISQLEELYNEFKDLVSGISVGGSYYLQFENLPEFINEVRIGEYMLYGSIPYCANRELFGTPALLFKSNVLEVYPERKQVLMKGGTSTINAKDCTLLSGGLEYSNASCDYTIYNDPLGKYKVGDEVKMIPDYNSLKLLRYVAREYKE